jgi:branched-chain amino acid transport system substrate-binding protein
MMVIMNAATSIITTKSPYCVRTSFTLPMVTETLGAWAVKNGIKKAYTLVSDFAPGHDAEQGFINAFKAGGGEIVGSVRMAVANPDFSAYIQRAKDLDPQSIFLFVPAGAQPAAFGKAFVERGMSTAKTRVLGTGELANDVALKQMGDASKGIITAWNYDHTHNSAKNKAFVAAYKKDNGGENPDFMSVGGYDGMHVIYEALKKTKGASGGDELTKAAKGMKWESPRGPMMIDPETNDVISTIYIRRVDKVGSDHRNVEIDSIPNVKDPVKEAMKKKKS